MNSYEKYKDSNIDWIGKIPRHWEVAKPKYKLNRVTRSPEKEDEVITCFRDGIVTLRKNRREDGFTVSLKEHGYQQICPGDLVVHEMDGFEGAIGVSDSKGKSTPVYTVIEPNKNADLKYIAYLLRVMSKTGKIESLGRSIRERTTDFRWNMWSVINFPFPPVNEQKLISEYLNKQTQQIDSLIGKIRKKIDLLKEKRTSVINQYLTKGLDLNIELKDAGISYIGKIPNHWTITRIKFVSEIINGFAFSSESFSKDNPIPVIRIGDVNQPIDLEKSMKVSNDTLSKYQEFCTRKNDILVAMTGGTIGKSALFSSDEISLINQRVCAFRSNSKVNQKFLYLFITSLIFKLQVDLNCIGGAQPNIGKDELMNFHIVLPPLDEQKEIAHILNRKMYILEKIIKKENNRIFLMHEYRQSLISSVVTGKIRITEEMI